MKNAYQKSVEKAHKFVAKFLRKIYGPDWYCNTVEFEIHRNRPMEWTQYGWEGRVNYEGSIGDCGTHRRIDNALLIYAGPVNKLLWRVEVISNGLGDVSKRFYRHKVGYVINWETVLGEKID